MWNPFKKTSSSNNGSDDKDNTQNMGFVQRLAMKKMMSMSPEQREKMMKKIMTPENISKNKDKILEAMEQMKASGQMSASQVEEAKRRLGL
ncbi:MAG: hypothetical protein WC906_05260 [Parcubacteria group bacterium]|jgi:hypothetical protein